MAARLSFLIVQNNDDQEEKNNMCGIVGYVGREQAAPILLDGLQRLEYRGYDSAGVAVYGPERACCRDARPRAACRC